MSEIEDRIAKEIQEGMVREAGSDDCTDCHYYITDYSVDKPDVCDFTGESVHSEQRCPADVAFSKTKAHAILKDKGIARGLELLALEKAGKLAQLFTAPLEGTTRIGEGRWMKPLPPTEETG